MCLCAALWSGERGQGGELSKEDLVSFFPSRVLVTPFRPFAADPIRHLNLADTSSAALEELLRGTLRFSHLTPRVVWLDPTHRRIEVYKEYFVLIIFHIAVESVIVWQASWPFCLRFFSCSCSAHRNLSAPSSPSSLLPISGHSPYWFSDFALSFPCRSVPVVDNSNIRVGSKWNKMPLPEPILFSSKFM